MYEYTLKAGYFHSFILWLQLVILKNILNQAYEESPSTCFDILKTCEIKIMGTFSTIVNTWDLVVIQNRIQILTLLLTTWINNLTALILNFITQKRAC